MQGVEQDLIAGPVAAGDVKLVFWPMLDLGPNSTNSAVAAYCAGEQDPAAFWQVHDRLYEDQPRVYFAMRDYYLQTVQGLGLDEAAFAACYDGPEIRAILEELDQTRRDNDVRVRPTFDIAGPGGEPERIFGSQSLAVFEAIIAAKLP